MPHGPAEVGRRPVAGALARPGEQYDARAARARATGATSSTATATGRSRRSSPTSTPAGTTSTSRSRTGSTTSTSARSSAPPTRSSPREVHIVGNRRWNRRGAMVTDRYQHVRHHADASRPSRRTCHEQRRRRCSASTTCPARCRSRRPTLPRRVLLALRPGGAGPLRAAPGRPATATFSIAQFGSTRSINASAAAAIAMHAWVRQHADLGDAWRGQCRSTGDPAPRVTRG